VLLQGGAAFKALEAAVRSTISRGTELPELRDHADALALTLDDLLSATQAAWATQVPDEALANATPYLQAFGHVVMAWIWLDIGLKATAIVQQPGPQPLASGLLAALRYFYAYELPKVDAWLKVVRERESVCRTMLNDWF